MRGNQTGIDDFEGAVFYRELLYEMIQLTALFDDVIDTIQYCLNKGYCIPQSASELYNFVNAKIE